MPPAIPVALIAADVPARTRPSNYPEPFASRVSGRIKRPLGDAVGLRHFGVNLMELAPGAASALRHAHSKQGEFVHVVDGEVILCSVAGRTVPSRPSRSATGRPVLR